MWRQIIFVTMLSAFAFVPLNGCNSYRGAVYADYTQTGLGVRAAPETGTPASVNFGYDRGVMANVPKRDGGRLKGEAVSLISKNNVFTIESSKEGILGKRSDVTVDAAFITGTAALVAVVPAGTKVHLVEQPSVSDGPVPPVQMKMGKADQKAALTLDVTGSPAERVAEAFKPTSRFVVPEQKILQDLFDRIKTRSEAQQEAIFEKAAESLPQEFQNLYREQKEKSPRQPRKAFEPARIKYSVIAKITEEVRTKRMNEIINALRQALESNQ